MPWYRSLLCCMLLVMAGACTPAPPAAAPVSTSVPTAALPATHLVSTPTPTLLAAPPASIAVLVEPAPVVEMNPAQAAEPAICSPLALHSLAELPGIVSDPYAPPRPGREERHHGVDFAFYRAVEPKSILGEGVQSVFSGVVALSLAGSFPYGNVIIIETNPADLPSGLAALAALEPGDALYLLYAHLNSPPLAALGDPVAACQALGAAGQSGNAAVPHLHLETRIGPTGTRFSGMQFYDTRARAEDTENYVLWRTSGVYQHFDPLLILIEP
jgi:murein DD-endopeptidase MepM/ murein hydrolase activator NlpD